MACSANGLQKRVRVNRKAAGRVHSGHLWIFSSDVIDHAGASAGECVHVVDPAGEPLGTAHYSTSSQITLRLLSRRPIAADRNFFLEQIGEAERHRRRVVSDTEAYRVVHGEGDLLPGLIVDRYGNYLSVQHLDQGMDRAAGEIQSVLEELFAPRGIVARDDSPAREKESLPRDVRVAAGDMPAAAEFRMNGLRLSADLLRGQKTGVFLDQRENYLAAAKYARGKALDCFTSTGGFALHLAPNCEHVEAADTSAPALATARHNAAANGIGNVEFRQADIFDLLAGYASARRQFDVVVLDPPAFTKSRKALEGAGRGYKDINLRALRLLGPGGILITCSCSHHLGEAAFLEIVAQAALDAGRTLRVLERRTQARDHPILLTVPETHYLKCLILEVM